MIRLLIVDDEKTTRNGLIKHLDWNQLNIDMVHTAASGQEAIRHSEQFEPDIILSDIRMRGMNGIEMCTELRDRFPECKIIFISGYADKAYLKAAITLGAVNYVEKPIDIKELEAAVKKAVAELEKARERRRQGLDSANYIKKQSLTALLTKAHIGEEFHKLVEQTGLAFYSKKFLRVCILHTKNLIVNLSGYRDNLLQNEGLAQLSTLADIEFLDNRRIALILLGTEEELDNFSITMQKLQAHVENHKGSPFFLAAGCIETSPAGIHKSYMYAKMAENALFYKGYGNISYQGSEAVDSYEPMDLFIERLVTAMRAGNTNHAVAVVNDLSDTLKAKKTVQNTYIKSGYYSIWAAIMKEHIHIYPPAKDSIRQSYDTDSQMLEKLDTIEDLKQFLVNKITSLAAIHNKDVSNNAVVTKVKFIIEREYSRSNLSVKEMAKDVFLTPTYLSTLFKQKTGETIGQYITKVRTARAKELLKNPQIKLYAVAEAVGYDDANYFTKIFKKQTGRTPSEYREKHE